MNDTTNNPQQPAANQDSDSLIRTIYTITSAHEQGFEYQMQALLKTGLQRFGLDIGILSKIENDTYTVEHCVVPEEMSISVGDTFEYAKTYCHITCEKNTTMAFEQVGMHDEYAQHPAYLALGLESYIGIPIRINGALYGTLNFSSAKPFPRNFEAADLDAMLLMASWIEAELVRREQEAQLKTLNEKLENEVLLDSLTQIPNRRGMQAHLRRELSRLMRTGGRATLALVDIDHFKALNDTHGHLAGDKALVATAKTISNSIRGYDYIARYGGEEFLLLLPDTSLKLSGIVCNRILQNIAAQDFPHGKLTASVGSCQIECSEMESTDMDATIKQAIGWADEALYAAKNAGRNCHLIYGQHEAAA
ncbi:MAG: sensor domain-containing diguanylate cyclase [Gammaproteobacteria bacterium]|nr:sensor domain-containing diguanylate cyclase [Gammaproteobacteria bacterium]MBT8150588.1 sensor domain-containing diguanylate cyclase [Gammaproteobacteria bacterium]NNM11190.1 GGDEF domain-containing protein [Pseudomonadales bacterium]RZV57938.1 MAG: sensor domain-containing diguanylate cyclase [Pseudomonadales bacterium]